MYLKKYEPKWIIVRYGVDDVAMAFQCMQLLLRCRVPDLTRPVVTARYETAHRQQGAISQQSTCLKMKPTLHFDTQTDGSYTSGRNCPL